MHRLRLNRFTAALLGFVLGVCSGILGHSLVATETFRPGKVGCCDEAEWVTSPDRKLDAVLMEDLGGGPLGGIFWCVYVVPKGESVPRDAGQRLFFADELTKGTTIEAPD